jgi:hypothetical protein
MQSIGAYELSVLDSQYGGCFSYLQNVTVGKVHSVHVYFDRKQGRPLAVIVAGALRESGFFSTVTVTSQPPK